MKEHCILRLFIIFVHRLIRFDHSNHFLSNSFFFLNFQKCNEAEKPKLHSFDFMQMNGSSLRQKYHRKSIVRSILMDTVFYYFYMLCETFKDYVAKSLICRDGGIQSKYSKNGRPMGEKKRYSIS